ncbi:MAG: hypothetical protein ACP5PN_03430 [Steroidobacteraceae bacterium]
MVFDHRLELQVRDVDAARHLDYRAGKTLVLAQERSLVPNLGVATEAARYGKHLSDAAETLRLRCGERRSIAPARTGCSAQPVRTRPSPKPDAVGTSGHLAMRGLLDAYAALSQFLVRRSHNASVSTRHRRRPDAV